MHPLNVFNNPKLPLRYPKNWIATIRMWRRSFIYAYQRITRGVADCDYWDLDNYFLKIFVEGIDLLLKKQQGWPGNEEFPTPESWDEYLKEMRDCFYRADETNEYYSTPYGDAWWAGVQAGEEDPDAVTPMCNEEKKNQENRETDLKKGIEMLKHCFYLLWD